MKKDPERSAAQDAYDAAKKRFTQLKAGGLALEKAQAEYNLLDQDRKILQGKIDAAHQRAESALQMAQRAQQQFRDNQSQETISAIESSLNQGQFASAQGAAEKFTQQLQRAPGSQRGLASAPSGFGFPDWGLGLGAVAVLGGLGYYFHVLGKPEKKLEEI